MDGPWESAGWPVAISSAALGDAPDPGALFSDTALEPAATDQSDRLPPSEASEACSGTLQGNPPPALPWPPPLPWIQQLEGHSPGLPPSQEPGPAHPLASDLTHPPSHTPAAPSRLAGIFKLPRVTPGASSATTITRPPPWPQHQLPASIHILPATPAFSPARDTSDLSLVVLGSLQLGAGTHLWQLGSLPCLFRAPGK